MKLTYLIPNLTVKQACVLEELLEREGLAFEARPGDPGLGAAPTPLIELPAPEINHRHKLSQAEVVDVYRRILSDERAGKRLKGEEYAAEYGIAGTTVSRIARGEHPHLTGAIKAHVQAEVEGAYRMVGSPAAVQESPTSPTGPTPGELIEPSVGAGALLLEADPLPVDGTPVPDAWPNANL